MRVVRPVIKDEPVASALGESTGLVLAVEASSVQSPAFDPIFTGTDSADDDSGLLLRVLSTAETSTVSAWGMVSRSESKKARGYYFTS